MTMAPISTVPPPPISRPLLAWYDQHRRHLPWRVAPGVQPQPYQVWLSEIMLQQTTVITVGPYFEAFLNRWPTIEQLAGAELDAILHAWQGLGYYARARNLHKCAVIVANEFAGKFPTAEAELRKLPGIGPYTAAAIAAIAFAQPAVPVDGNVERVMARLHRVEIPLPAAKKVLAGLAQSHVNIQRPGDFAQALMDLGATICLPRSPKCSGCPLRRCCRAAAAGAPERLPRKTPKAAKSSRYGVVFWLEAPSGEILLRRRPESGLLGGMMEFPSTEWRDEPWRLATAKHHSPIKTRWKTLPGTVSHGFTHFDIEFVILAGRCDRKTATGVWCYTGGFKELALPTVMKKIAHHALLYSDP